MHEYLPKVGGAQICAHCLAHSLSKMGHTVTVYADERLVKDCESRNWHFPYNLTGINKWPFRIIRLLPLFRSWILKTVMSSKVFKDRLDVIQIVFALPWLSAVKEVKKKTKVPVVIRCAGDDIQIDDSIGYGVRRDLKTEELLSRGFSAIDKGIAISATVTTEYIKAGIPQNRIIEIPPGVDFEAFRNCQINKDKIRQQWGIPLDKKVIISVGRNHPKKGFEDLLSCLPRLNQAGNRFVAVIVGKGTDELLPHAEKIGVQDNFIPIKQIISMSEDVGTFPSRELIELYKASDYFVLPSYIETYANVALEAMAAGIPVIVTDAPGCIDTVVDEKDGLIVPVNASDKIADKILLLEENQALKATIVRNGLKKAENQDWDNIAEKYLQAYKECCKNQSS